MENHQHMSRRVVPVLIASLTAVLTLPAVASAAYFPGEPIDGPTADIVRLGDVDIARDGTGAVAYVKRDGGVDHVFVSRIARGVWSPPERVDASLPSASAQPVVAAADGGKAAVAFVSGGSLFVVTRLDGAPTFTAPTLVAAGASNPAIDMSINGASYLSFTAPGASAADVRVAHLERRGTQFNVLPDTLDITPARDAGDGTKRSQVAISADGTGLVVWGETGDDGRTHVYARRVFRERISVAPQDLTLSELEGRAGRDADLPSLDIEDDSSYAWVAFRQAFLDGVALRTRVITRRLRGSQFEEPFTADGVAFGTGEAATTPRVALNGRGEGIIAAASVGAAGAIGTPVHDDKIFPAYRFDTGNAVAPQPFPAFPETGDGYLAWLQGVPGAAQVRVRGWDIDVTKRDVGPPAAEIPLSDPGLGAVDPTAGFDGASNRAGDLVVLYVQGTGENRRLMSATFDRVPGRFRVYTTSKYRRYLRPPLSWQPSFELWGPLTYSVQIDGVDVGTTQDTKLKPLVKLTDGAHKVRVVATDRRGQTATTKTSTIRVDGTAPELAVRISGTRKAGKALKFRLTADDVRNGTGRSGLKYVRVDFGDRTPRITLKGRSATVSHAYERGRYTLRVTARDRAGNVEVVRRRLTIKKAGK